MSSLTLEERSEQSLPGSKFKVPGSRFQSVQSSDAAEVSTMMPASAQTNAATKWTRAKWHRPWGRLREQIRFRGCSFLAEQQGGWASTLNFEHGTLNAARSTGAGRFFGTKTPTVLSSRSKSVTGYRWCKEIFRALITAQHH